MTDTTVAGEEPPASVPGDHGDRGDGDDDGSTGVIDLAPSPPDLDQFRRPAAVASDAAIDVSFTTHEPWRRRTAAVSLTGGLVVVMLGAAFGLRERAIVRKRSMP